MHLLPDATNSPTISLIRQLQQSVVCDFWRIEKNYSQTSKRIGIQTQKVNLFTFRSIEHIKITFRKRESSWIASTVFCISRTIAEARTLKQFYHRWYLELVSSLFIHYRFFFLLLLNRMYICTYKYMCIAA